MPEYSKVPRFKTENWMNIKKTIRKNPQVKKIQSNLLEKGEYLITNLKIR